jgi:predicted O-linked N-acetylglucosamine transferase (SPINDLY family)
MNRKEMDLELAEQLLLAGKSAEAITLCQSLLAEQPDATEPLYLLGNAAATMGDWETAIHAFRKACSVAPGLPLLLNNLGLALLEGAKQTVPVPGASFAEAAVSLQQALAIQPDYLNAWENLGLVRRAEGKLEEAKQCMLEGLAVDHSAVSLWLQLAALHVATYHFDQAAFCYCKALQSNPEDPADALNRLATVQVYAGKTVKALDTFFQAIIQAKIPEQKRSYTQNRLFTLHYPFDITPEQIANEHRKWGEVFFTPPGKQQFINTPLPERRLRIGYVSPDFRMNAVSFFIQPILAAHNPEQVEVYCYANVEKPDIVTAQLQKHPVVWRDIYAVGDQEVFRQIQDDRIDILVELAGHGANNRLALFALRPAPIQVAWIGYPDTTGLPAMDYRITDSIADPPGMTEQFHTEQLLRLDPSFLCYRPGEDFPEQTACPPVVHQGFISFGTMSNFSKTNEVILELWADIMAAVPGSRLVLRYRGGEQERIRQELAAVLSTRGVDEQRLLLLGHATSVVQQLEGYHHIDIALDTFPYNGTTTTCETLFMGVPVVTLAGRSHVSRVGASLLQAVGLPELVCNSMEEYKTTALALAADIPRLINLHQTLRKKLLNSPLCDNHVAAAGVEQLYRTVWRRWCQTQGVLNEQDAS